MTTPQDPEDDLPSFSTRAGGLLSGEQREISDKALLYAEAGPPVIAAPVMAFDAPGDPGHASHGSHGSHGSW